MGSISRYFVSKLVSNQLEHLPVGTFVVNILGCFLIGVILGVLEKYRLHSDLGLLLATGFCGGFTTFSSFAYENYTLLKNQNYLFFMYYTFFSIVIGFMAVFLGMVLVKRG